MRDLLSERTNVDWPRFGKVLRPMVLKLEQASELSRRLVKTDPWALFPGFQIHILTEPENLHF